RAREEEARGHGDGKTAPKAANEGAAARAVDQEDARAEQQGRAGRADERGAPLPEQCESDRDRNGEGDPRRLDGEGDDRNRGEEREAPPRRRQAASGRRLE